MKVLIFIFFISSFLVRGQGIIVGDSVSAGIIYNNIKDSALPFIAKGISICEIDIDNDNIFDIRFYHEHQSSPAYNCIYRKVFPLTNIEFAVKTSTLYIDTLPLNSNVNSSLNWKGVVGFHLRYNCSSITGNSDNGVFKSSNNYLGFRKIQSTDTIYGWFLLDMTGTIKIKSYAYQANNQAGVGITNLTLSKMAAYLFPNPVNEILHIKNSGSQSQSSEIEIINCLGQVILKIPFANTIDVSKLPNGIYTLKIISSENKNFFSKFVKE